MPTEETHPDSPPGGRDPKPAEGFPQDDRANQGGRLLTPGAGTLLTLYVLGFAAIFLATRYGIDATGRYLLPLNLPLVLGMAAFIALAWRRKRAWGCLLLLLVLAINGLETARAAAAVDGITTQFDPLTRFDNRHDAELMAFLQEQGELRGYTNYWVSFRLAFLSGEELLYAALLPYKPDWSYSPSDNRYPAYARAVAESSRVAYITSLQPDFDARLRQELSALGVFFNERQIGPYHLFYHLSRPVRPVELDWQDSQ